MAPGVDSPHQQGPEGEQKARCFMTEEKAKMVLKGYLPLGWKEGSMAGKWNKGRVICIIGSGMKCSDETKGRKIGAQCFMRL